MISLLLAAAPAAPATQDWPHWNGPDRDGVAKEDAWVDRGEIAWTVHAGLGYSSVSVVGDALYTLGHDPEARLDRVLCLDAATGEERWRYEFEAETMANFHTGGTLSTPTVAGGRVFVSNREGKAFCFDASSGAVLWEKDYKTELELPSTMYGYSASPLADRGELFLLLGGNLLKVDPTNGEVLHRGEDWGDGGYSNPLPFDLRGRACLAVFAAPGLLVIDRDTFEELHRFPWKGQGGGVHAGTPVVLPEDRIYISSAYGAGAALLALGDEPEPELVWRSRRMRNKVDGSVFIDGFFYGFDESMLKCLDLEGEERWRVRGLGMGAVGAAGDRLLVLTSKGELIVAEATPDEFRELSRQPVLEQDEGVCWTFPVLVRGRVYCRGSEGDLVCVDHRSSVAPVVEATAVAHTGAVPRPPALFARHATALGGDPSERAGARIEGALEVIGAGITRCPMTIDWAAPDRWSQQYFLGEFGSVHRAHDGEIAWVLDPFYGDRLLADDELREAADERRFVMGAADPDGYAAWRTVGLMDFAGHRCWAVDTVSRRGARRRLYFDQATGLLRGREGLTEHLVVLDAYREFDGIQLPTRITRVAPETGEEERWFVETVSWQAPEPSAFAWPEKVRKLMRDPAEVEAANAVITERYSEYFGTYGDVEALHYVAQAHEGEFALTFGGRGFGLSPVEGEADTFVLADMPAIKVLFRRDEDGRPRSVEMFGGPVEEPQVLERVDAADSDSSSEESSDADDE